MTYSRMIEFINSRESRLGESPSFGTAASARGMAKLAAAMANQGEVGRLSSCLILIIICRNSQQVPEGAASLMSAKTWDLMHDNPIKRLDAAMFVETNFSQGGVHFYG